MDTKGKRQAQLPVLSLILLLTCLLTVTGCGSDPGSAVTGFADLEDKRIGVTTGSVQALQTETRFPDAEIFYFSSDVDMLAALRSNKIDAYASADAIAK